MYIRVFTEQGPIEPIDFVVLTVGIVIAVLRSPNFIAHYEHRQAKREHCNGEEILHLTVSESIYDLIIGRTLETAVPTSIIVRAVAVIFTIALIMLYVVGNEIVEGKSVVTRYEVHALFRLAFFVAIDLVAADEPVRKMLH